MQLYCKSDQDAKRVLRESNDVIMSTDLNGNFVCFNKAYKTEFEKIFGKEINIGDNLFERLSHVPDDLENAKKLWDFAISGEKQVILTQFGDKSLERNYYELSYFPIRDEKGEISGIAHIGKNVTEREKLKIKATESVRAKSLFLSSISHELRTPLNAILGFSQLIEIEKDTKNLSSYIKTIIRAGKYLLGLINNILDINNITSTSKIKCTSVNAYSEIDKICDDMKIMLKSSDVSLITNLKRYKRINIKVNKQKYKQIVINLITNAIKYNKSNGQIIIDGKIINDKFYIMIKDTGIGISQEHLGKICQPFERLGNEASSIEGTGLGLLIVKSLCEKMNGILEIDSVLGEGSVFSVGFDITDNSAKKNKKLIKYDISKMKINYDYTGKIYYIEDNNFNLYLMGKIIKNNFPNCQYSYENNGLESLKYIEKNKPEIVILDLNIPEMQGIDVLKNIKKNTQLDNIHVIVVTANINEEISNKCYDFGCYAFMTKPYIVPELVKKLNDAISDAKSSNSSDDSDSSNSIELLKSPKSLSISKPEPEPEPEPSSSSNSN